MTSSAIVQKLWNYCNILRDDGLSYGDYVEQLTFLLFLKMADEQSRPPYKKTSPVRKGYDWPSLLAKDGDDLEIHYRHMLETLGKEKGMLGVIFRKAQNKIQDPAKLRRLIVDLIDKEQWSALSADVKGGAGQYFTPRPLIAAIVDVMRPEPGKTICDPACGTGGFLLAAYTYLSDPQRYQLDRAQKKQLAGKTLFGVELVDSVARLCCMNLLLHGISADGTKEVPVEIRDALASHGGRYYEMVMTNPPFGKKSSVTMTSSGSRTNRWKSRPTCPRPISLPPKLSKTSKRPSNNSAKSLPT